jgi:translation initiation factor IF-1
MFSELLPELELEVDVLDDVLASCAIPGKGRITSTKLFSFVVCMDNW